MIKQNESASGSALVLTIFTSLLFSTVLITWFMLQMYGVSVAGIDMPTGQTGYSNTQSFMNNQINDTTLDISKYGIWQYQDGIGRVLIQKSTSGWTYLLINNIQRDSQGIITNTYYINNSVKQDYTIVLRYTGSVDHTEFTITNDGIHVPNWYMGAVISSPLVIPYPNMNQVSDIVIVTKYNDLQNTCEINFNGQSFTLSNLPVDMDTHNAFKNYYGGVASNTLGFTIETFASENKIVNTGETDILTLFGAFIVTVLKLIFFNVSPDLLPWEINILLIKSQTIALLIGIYVMVRSGT